MPLSSMKLIIKLFADDSLLFVLGKNFAEIQETLNIELPKIEAWFLSNKLTINASKTEYMINGRIQSENPLNICLNNMFLVCNNGILYKKIYWVA